MNLIYNFFEINVNIIHIRILGGHLMLSTTIKKVRISKGLSQKDIARNYLSQGNYSKFENGLLDIPFSKVIGILNNLDIGLDELLFIDNDYKYSVKETIFRDFFRMPFKNPSQLESIIARCNAYSVEDDNELIAIIKQISLFLIESIKCNDIYFNKDQAQYLLDVFSKKEHLYIKDLYLINSIFFLFPIETAHLTLNFVEASLKKYRDFQSINRLEVNFRLNYSLMLIKEGFEDKAIQQLELVLTLAKKYKFSIQMAIIYIRMGICFSNLQNDSVEDYIQKGLNILKALDEVELLENMEKEISNYLKQPNNH